MKIHGYCNGCHRVRRVTITGSAMARTMMRGVPEGTCDECAQAEEDRRRRR